MEFVDWRMAQAAHQALLLDAEAYRLWLLAHSTRYRVKCELIAQQVCSAYKVGLFG